ncbi:MAG TPA: protein translocase subunit SecD [Aggregatilineales bacterium]|nr:protein translocase subunit SecD [Aggregatilineales bacterium]
MRNSTGPWLVVIAAVTIFCLFLIVANPNLFGKQISPHPGLDIQGGLRVLLRAKPGSDLSGGKLDVARQIIERRVNALGVSEPTIQIAGADEIVVEIPGITNPQAAIDTIKETGLLEFVDFSTTGCVGGTTPQFPVADQYILTDAQLRLTGGGNPNASSVTNATAAATQAATAAATANVTVAATMTPTQTSTPEPTDALFKLFQGTTEPTMVATSAFIAPPNTTPVPTVASPVPTTQAATAVTTANATALAATAAATRLATGQATANATTQATAAATAGAQATAAATQVAAGVPGSSKDNPLKNPCTGQPFITVMTGAGLQNANRQIGGQGNNQYVVNFQLVGNDESQKFANFTSSHIGQPMAIVLDGKVLSAPVIQAALTTGGEITGNFTAAQADDLALQLRYGALPVSLDIIGTQTVGPSLGASSVQASVRAGVVGVIMVLVFMLVYYRIPGVAAALALMLFVLINVALYEFIPVTLTLPAIVGFLISTGAAVDGNILIFERIKEELRAGRPLNKALDLGFARAWPSIRDSNISTILIGLILYFFGGTFGASAVRGFAVTLILGLVTNLFTAIIVTRTLLNLVLAVGGEALHRVKLFDV